MFISIHHTTGRKMARKKENNTSHDKLN